jgi:enterochelin esterase-like enzyme
VLTFRVADPEQALAGVRLQLDLRMAAELLEFRRAGESWELELDQPPLSRLEYLLELRYPDGGSKVVTDPSNPLEVSGAFGPKSVLEFAGYVPPAWVAGPADVGTLHDVNLPVAVRIWAPVGAGPDEPMPLLVVHDGPEYDALASLTRYLGAGIAGGWLPPLRAALLSPGPRNNWYSANSRYARSLRERVLPALGVASTAVIGMGTSLGGLAMLHALCQYPDAVDALFLQSGSFFTPLLDSQERRFPYFRRITQFTAAVHAGGLPDRPVPVVMTCGAIEENIENNRLMLATLSSRGYPADLHEVADMHNYTAWRDAFDPHLTALLRQVAG